MNRTCDPKVYDLAAQFLSDHPSLDTESSKDMLACAIQSAIEMEISLMLEDELEVRAS